ncbi:YcjF family protein [Chachezhania antarctica]|uniref:YcjF family protein n=1 Tax=Chachezhania antarctica TaxID=2340860 RepID=UPI000EB46C25|nr:TIGR01620 family protein [Chachezhania antarctica]
MSRGPVIFDLDEDRDGAVPDVGDAPPVDDTGAMAERGAMVAAARLAGRQKRTSRLSRWFWALAGAVVTALLSVAAWQFAADLVARVPVLGWIITALLVAFVVVALLLAIREVAAIGRLARLDGIRSEAEAALMAGDLEATRAAAGRVVAFYAHRPELAAGRETVAARLGDMFEPVDVMRLVELEVLESLDRAAVLEVEASARQVAMVTALVPLALADVVAALTNALRMIRRIGEIYGGRSGLVGSWRLTRAVLGHMVATGAVAAADDMIEPILGGSLLSKLSRRFGEGVVNGALTARVGLAAIDVCRPVPFSEGARPSSGRIVKAALTGLFSRGDREG